MSRFLSKASGLLFLFAGFLVPVFLIAQPAFSFPEVEDLPVSADFIHTKERLSWERTPFYLGPVCPSVASPWVFGGISKYQYINSNNKYKSDGYYSNSFTQYIKTYLDTLNSHILAEDTWEGDQLCQQYLHARLLVLENTSTDSSVNIGFGYNCPVILEGIDSTGTWKAIEYSYSYDCGFGMNPILLAPGSIACLLIPMYTGSYHTKLRLRIGYRNRTRTYLYSEPFTGSIEYSQFK